jgi:thioredoxin-like negative regulator of GroEL
MTFLVPLLLLFCLNPSPSPHGWMQDTKPTADASDLAGADRLYQSGDFAEAAEKYQAILKADPNSAQAQSGVIRSLLKEEKIDDALTLAKSAAAAQPNSSAVGRDG